MVAAVRATAVDEFLSVWLLCFCFFLGLGLRRVALGLGHFQEALALARVLALAVVIGALAGGLALAGVDPFAFHLRFVSGTGGRDGSHRENHRGSGGERNARHLSRVHPRFS